MTPERAKEILDSTKRPEGRPSMNKRERRAIALEMASRAVGGWCYTVEASTKDQELIQEEVQRIADRLEEQAARLEGGGQ